MSKNTIINNYPLQKLILVIKMKKYTHSNVQLDQKKEDFDNSTSSVYYDYVQIGPLEEEILKEFYFDRNQFKKYMEKNQKK